MENYDALLFNNTIEQFRSVVFPCHDDMKLLICFIHRTWMTGLEMEIGYEFRYSAILLACMALSQLTNTNTELKKN